MTINELNNLKEGYWLNDIDAVRTVIRTHPLSKKSLKISKEKIKYFYDKNNLGKCLNWILVILIYNESESIESLKKMGVLKLTNNDNKYKFSKKIIFKLFENSEDIITNKKIIKYLKSKLEMSLIIDDYYELKSRINKSLSDVDICFVTDVLFLADYEFYSISEEESKDRILPKYNIILESFIDSISYLIFLYGKINGLKNINNACFYKDNVINNETYIDLIKKANSIKEFDKTEVYIDSFEYYCKLIDTTLVVKSDDVMYEKSIWYGFIYTDFQSTNSISDALSNINGDIQSLSSFIDKSFVHKDKFIKLVTEPISRYTMQIPKIEDFINFFKEESLYYEEFANLVTDEKDNITEKSQLIQYKLSEELTLWDIIVVKRALILLTGILYKQLKIVESHDPSLSYRSWLHTFRKDKLIEFLSTFISEKKAKEFIQTFTWDIKSKSLLDLQFTPIIRISGEYYLCNNIFIKSSTLRNTIVKERLKRPIENNEDDVTSTIVHSELSKKFNKVCLELTYNNSGFHGDFDVLMYTEKTIYIFECKNIIKPAGFFELRTTLDNLRKGFAQLDKAKSAFSTHSFIQYINQKLQWNITKKDLKVVTCLVFSNRMFNGYTDGVHHVRSVHELSNFISTGTIRTANETLSLWSSKDITGSDIYKYIEEDILHSITFESMVPLYECNRLINTKIAKRSYALHIESSLSAIKSKFKTVPNVKATSL